MRLSLSPHLITLISSLGILAIGYLDYVTGSEIRIFPLYFIPLAFASWHLQRSVASCLALWAAGVWIMSLVLEHHHFSHWTIWIINFCTQAIAFELLAILVSHLRTALQKEQFLSQRDPLTGLFNRRMFLEQAGGLLRFSIRYQHPICAVYVDLDNFKQANDSKGHAFGDRVLCEVADILRNNLRDTDIVARMGGDEFALLLPYISEPQTRVVIQKLRERFTEAPLLQMGKVTASIGAVHFAKPPADVEHMLKAADALMYQVKKSGRNDVRLETAAD